MILIKFITFFHFVSIWPIWCFHVHFSSIHIPSIYISSPSLEVDCRGPIYDFVSFSFWENVCMENLKPVMCGLVQPLFHSTASSAYSKLFSSFPSFPNMSLIIKLNKTGLITLPCGISVSPVPSVKGSYTFCHQFPSYLSLLKGLLSTWYHMLFLYLKHCQHYLFHNHK